MVPSALSSPTVPVAVVAVAPLAEVTDRQLALYADLIYRRTGIRVAPQKKTLLSNRLRRRLRQTGISGFTEYYEHLQRLSADDPEWDQFLQEITTHETYLFRDENQWNWFQGTYLPQCAAEARAGRRPSSLRIWSAACSTGDEAFTAACCAAGCLPDCRQWQVRILGTDIGVGAVAQAKAASFSERAMRLVPQTYKTRYFSKEPNAPAWQARPILTGMVAFRAHNLLDPLLERPFDLVFLKNVLIYFEPASKQKVLENVRTLIQPGGLLVAGPAEGVGDLLRDYVRLQPWLYQRPRK
jgi:chemotaxis protein methyltransferase CheR